MMMKWICGDMQITYAVDDLEVKELLKRLEKKAGNMKPAMQDISVYMKHEVMGNFKAQGRPRKWQPLSAKYAKFKAESNGAGKPILEFNGKLKQSINTRYSEDNAAAYTGVKYGVYHQTGTSKMPERPFMPNKSTPNMPPFDTKGIERIKQILELYITQEVKT